MRSSLVIALLMLLPGLLVAQEATYHSVSYHDVRDHVDGNYDRDQYAVSTSNLIAQFSWLRDNGFRPISVDDIIRAEGGETPLPEKAVLLTFDDGLVSFYTRVYPLLKLFEYPAVLSIVTSWIGTSGEMEYAGRSLDQSGFVSWDQIREMQESGLVEIASHSHDLHRGIAGNPQGNMQPAAVTRLYDGTNYESDVQYLERIQNDLAQSAAAIQGGTGELPRVITWPYGAYNEQVVAIAAGLGMRVNLTLHDRTINRGSSLLVGRFLAVSNPSISDFSGELLQRPPEPIIRVAQVDLDYLYDSNTAQQQKNLDRLIDRIKSLGISHVFLQAFSDLDADGGAEALYFPNRHLPVRADIFNRVAWQLRTRASVRVYAWLPMLSYVGGSFDPEWRVKQMRSNRMSTDPNSEPRLSPFNSDAVARIIEIFEDLAIHARFDGILFHDDGRLSDIEDFSPAAKEAYSSALGQELTPEIVNQNPLLAQKWAEFKTETLIDLSQKQLSAVRRYAPEAKSARNLFASALLDRSSSTYLAQDYDRFLATYDYVALMAMPHLEGHTDENQFFLSLVDVVRSRDTGFVRTIFELQTKDWSNSSAPIDSSRLSDRMRWLQSLGVLHLGYYPDDFILGHPDAGQIRIGMSLADAFQDASQ